MCEVCTSHAHGGPRLSHPGSGALARRPPPSWAASGDGVGLGKPLRRGSARDTAVVPPHVLPATQRERGVPARPERAGKGRRNQTTAGLAFVQP